MAGRYVCRKNKKVTIGKANAVCLIRRCPELLINKNILVRGKLKHIVIPAIPALLVDNDGKCEGD